MKLYVGNLSFDADQDSITDLFSAHGEVTSVNIITDRDTGRARGFGFVEMPNKKEAIAAMNALADTEVNGRPIVVNEARPKANRY
ncbi:MAG: RNA-binding protein [Spirochaetales bacterium]|nr:RNA-binding protein [Leptospiraceae bacterium]MCP5482292.1 RNA-binding protein [Spirochaetales bacterium]MCP5484269.1 RNA-binding protein [Spirochaetales bacterium]